MKSITPIITLLTATASLNLNAQVEAPAAPAKKEVKVNAASPSTTPAPRGAEWWKKRHANQVKNANTNTNTTQRQLVFIGDSITQGWESGGKKMWSNHFSKWNALNLGISGDHTQHVIWRLQNGAFPESLKPKVAVIMIGTNNTGHGKGQPAADVAEGIRLIVDEVHSRSPKTQIILNAIFPRGATPKDKKRILNSEINQLISKLGERNYVHYQDINQRFLDEKGNLPKNIMPDLLHPNTKGYGIWTNALVPEIKKLMKDPLTSVSGFKATFVPGEGEGEGMTEIWKDGKKVASIPDSRPMSFSPVGDVLLLAEHAPDDDTKQYVLDIGKGESAMKSSRLEYVFGGRYVESATWSNDGSSITLHNHPDLGAVKKETFKVADLLKRK